MNESQAQEFTTKMMRAFGGILVRQETLSHVSIDALEIDLPALLPMNGITLGPFVYLKDGLDPWTQVRTITHECEHLAQLSKHPLDWLYFYVAEPEIRVRYETDAMRAEMELELVHSGNLPTQDEVRSALQKGYQLGPKDIDLGVLLFERAVTAAKGSGPSTQAGRIAIQVLGTAGQL